jgi:mono/diheme cytochrome c family protein
LATRKSVGAGIVVLVIGLSATPRPHAQRPSLDPSIVERGQRRFTESCGFCHGANARGGESGPDLVRSIVVLEDENGKRLGPLLKEGRTELGMPKFEHFSDEQITDVAAFLRSRVTAAARQGDIRLDASTFGNAAAGAAFFNGDGRCSTCHSESGDLKRVGGKYDVETLQSRMLMPRRSTAAGTARTATVRFRSGRSYSGSIVRLTDFDVTLEEHSGVRRSFLRHGAEPQIEVSDPLQAHVDLWTRLTDDQMHDLVAFLASLK